MESNPLGIPSPFLRLPPELLLHIFKATVPPLYQHDPSVVPGPRNPWLAALRTRKALVLTCKTFFAPATEVLYEDIVFRRMGQIPAFARTLGAFPPLYGRRPDFGLLVKRIRMDGCVIWAPCADVVREDLGLILRRCLSLRSFSFHPHPQFPIANDGSDFEGWDMFNPSWLVTANDDVTSVGGLMRHRFMTSLRSFDLAWTVDEIFLEHLQWFLSAAFHLTTLKLGGFAPTEDADNPTALRTNLTLPALRELQIDISHIPFEIHLAQHWTLPRLAALTLLGCSYVPEALLGAHGAHLTFLHVRHDDMPWDVSQLAPLARLPSLCPVLEHLVIPTWLRAPLPVHSPTLRWLDVWGHHPPPAILRAGYYQLAKESALPRFERMRILGTMPRERWGAALSVDWPRVCHPTALMGSDGEQGQEQRLYDFPGARVLQTAWGVLHDFYQGELTFSHGDGVEPTDTSGWYILMEGEGEDDGTSVVSDEAESFHASFELEEEGEEENVGDLADLIGAGRAVEPLGREGMLESFHESQDRYFLFDDE